MKDDLFTPIHPASALHPQFSIVMTSPIYAPGRKVMSALAEEMEDPDGNFIEQFQSHGFDSRTFELYLFALFREAGFTIDRRFDRPDFMLANKDIVIAVEAVTANPPPTKAIQPYQMLPVARSASETQAYLDHEVPIRLGSPLFSKLKKRYWELDHVRGKPLVLAIEDFHAPGSLGTSATPLSKYLLGLTPVWHHDQDGTLVITHQPITEHRVDEKVIPSGFFALPGAEFISGVLFTNAGTAPKFNRIGQEGRFRENGITLLRYGSCYRLDPNATTPGVFAYEVGRRREHESWRESSVFIHNPGAKYPIPIASLGASADNVLVDGQIETTFHEPFHPFASMTVQSPRRLPRSRVRAELNRLQKGAELLVAQR